MMYNFYVWTIALLCMASLVGCDDSNDDVLKGSITETYNMKSDSVRIRMYEGSALSIEWVKNKDGGDAIPLRITIDRPREEIVVGVAYDLTTSDGTIARGVGYDSTPLPTPQTGTVTLDAFSDEKVVGSFEATFVGTDNNIMNLRGEFSAKPETVL